MAVYQRTTAKGTKIESWYYRFMYKGKSISGVCYDCTTKKEAEKFEAKLIEKTKLEKPETYKELFDKYTALNQKYAELEQKHKNLVSVVRAYNQNHPSSMEVESDEEYEKQLEKERLRQEKKAANPRTGKLIGGIPKDENGYEYVDHIPETLK